MKTQDAIEYFEKKHKKGPRLHMARALGITSGAISQWGDVVPKLQAYELAELTNGDLKVDQSLYGPRHQARDLS